VGTSSTFAELGKKMEKAADELTRRSDAEIILASAKGVKKSVAAELARVAPGGRLNVGKNGQRVTVYYKLLRKGETAIVAMRGPAHLIERDTKAHLIGAGRSRTVSGRKFKNEARGRKASARKATRLLHIGNRVVVGPVRHPGTTGKHPFERGVKRHLPSVGKTFESGVDKIMGAVFR
jgi:hypothetical protein